MRIVVKAEKAGQVVAQSELEVKNEGALLKRARKAFVQFRKDHPDLDLFEPNLSVRFEKEG